MNTLAKAALDYQDRQDTREATDAMLRARSDARDLLNYQPKDANDKTPPGYFNLKGKYASDAFQAYKGQLEDNYEKYGASLSPNARAKYIAMTDQYKNSDLGKLSSHKVDQDQWYQGQQTYAVQQLAARDMIDDPYKGINSLLQARSTFEDQKSADQYMNHTGQMIYSNFANQGAAGIQQAEKFFGQYQQAFPPEVLTSVRTQIQNAKEALVAQATKASSQQKDNALTQAQVEIPVWGAKMLARGEYGQLMQGLTTVRQMAKPGDMTRGLEAESNIARDSVKRLYDFEGKSPEEVNAIVQGIRTQAAHANVDIPTHIWNGLQAGLVQIDKEDKTNTVKSDFNIARTAQDTIQIDPNNPQASKNTVSPQQFGELINSLSNTPAGYKLKSSLMQKYEAAEKGQVKVQTVEDKKQQDIAEKSYYWDAASGGIPAGSALDHQLLQARIDGTLSDAGYNRIVSLRDKSAGTALGTPEAEATHKAIAQMLTAGVFDPELSDKTGAKKGYTPSQISTEAKYNAGRFTQLVDNLMLTGVPGPAAVEQIKNSYGTKVSTGWFSSKEAIQVPETTVPNPVLQKPATAAPIQQQQQQQQAPPVSFGPKFTAYMNRPNLSPEAKVKVAKIKQSVLSTKDDNTRNQLIDELEGEFKK
jgi:acyl-CoA-binding protein